MISATAAATNNRSLHCFRCRCHLRRQECAIRDEPSLVVLPAPMSTVRLSRITFKNAMLHAAAGDPNPPVMDKHLDSARAGRAVARRPAIGTIATALSGPIGQMRVDVVCLR